MSKDSGLDDLKLPINHLRHSAATLNLLRGGYVEATKGLLRHREISSTIVYVDYLKRLNDDFESQIEAFILKENYDFWDNTFYFIKGQNEDSNI